MALFALLILFAQGQSPVDARKEIQARYDSWSKAYMANDVDGLLGTLAADYTLTTADRVVIKRSEYEATLRLRKAANSDSKKYATKILKFKLSGDTAEVESRESMTSEDTDPKTGKRESVIHEHDYEDTWIRSGEKWLLSRTITLKERTRIKLHILEVSPT